MSKVPWILVAALTIAPVASAEIFKCTSRDGLALYQNFPCEFNSLGSLPTQPAGAKAPSAPIEATQSKAKTVALEKISTSAQPRPLPGGLRVGMTTEEVKALWGEPLEMIQDEPRSGRVEIWQYGEGRSVQFNNKQRVMSVQR